MIIKPMLGYSKVIPLEDVRVPCIASPKIDGIRLFNWMGNCYTRTMKPIGCRFVQNYISNSVLKGLDGECVVGEPNDPKIFKKTTGAVRTHTAEPDFEWWVFDERIEEKDTRGFWARYTALRERFERGDFAQFHRVKLLEHVWIETHEELKAFEEKCAAEGWEGVMTRDPDGPYKNGRSTASEQWLLKRKLWDFAEAEIIGIYEQMTNENDAYINETGNTKRSTNAENLIPAGTLGGFLCRELGTGVEFSLGAGGSHEERQKLWDERAENDDYKGQFVRFKHMPYGRDVKPRQPIFDSFRLKEDIDVDNSF